jgi:hypothetical protein
MCCCTQEDNKRSGNNQVIKGQDGYLRDAKTFHQLGKKKISRTTSESFGQSFFKTWTF